MNTFRVAAVLLLAVLCAAGWGTAPANAAQLVLDTDPKEQLLTACQSGDKTELAMALTNGADINAKDMGDLTALHYASQKGHYGIAKILLEDGAFVDALSVDKTTPLMLAVEYSHQSVVKLLLRNGASTNLVDKSGADSLHRAAFINSPESVAILKVLLEHDATHVNRADLDGKTPLTLACERGNWRALSHLIAAGGDVDARVPGSNGATLLLMAALYGQPEAVKALLDAGASVYSMDNEWNGVLSYATYGKERQVKLPSGTNPGADYETTVELLLQHGAIYDDIKLRLVSGVGTIVVLTATVTYFLTRPKPSDAAPKPASSTGAAETTDNATASSDESDADADGGADEDEEVDDEGDDDNSEDEDR